MKMCRFCVFVCLIVASMFAPGTTGAENKTGALTLSPLIGGYVFEGNQDVKNKAAWGLGLGYNVNEHCTAEAVFNYIDTEYDTGSNDVDTYLYRIEGLYHFMPTEKFVPYVAAGIGGITFDPEHGKTDTDFLTNYGVGFKYFFAENLAFRGDVRHVISFDDTQSNLLYTAGLTFLFGGIKPSVEEPPLDSDGDGVADSIDGCPDTPAGVVVDSSGCPLDSDGDGVYDYLDKCPETPSGIEVDPKGCPLDSDGDGVYDYLDKCPGTPSGVKVDEKGCPLDSDKDGVPDDKDRCPFTPKGATVNEFGCWVCKGVNFDLNKWHIKPEFHQVLNEQVQFLKENPELIVEIQGHTCNIGAKEYNQNLSEKRAAAVMNYFIGKGIAKERLSAKGYGFSRPFASNDTREGRIKNRRVQLSACYDLMTK